MHRFLLGRSAMFILWLRLWILIYYELIGELGSKEFGMSDFEVNTCPINIYYILAEMIIAIRWVDFYLYRFSN